MSMSLPAPDNGQREAMVLSCRKNNELGAMFGELSDSLSTTKYVAWKMSSSARMGVRIIMINGASAGPKSVLPALGGRAWWGGFRQVALARAAQGQRRQWGEASEQATLSYPVPGGASISAPQKSIVLQQKSIYRIKRALQLT